MSSILNQQTKSSVIPNPSASLGQQAWINALNQTLGPGWTAKKSSTSYTFEQDALIVSCTVHRLRDQQGVNLSLQDPKIYNHISDQDRELAENIRGYYSKKLMLLQLKNSSMSKFRSDLAKFISGTGHEVDIETLGMVYRLPEFYAYDTMLDQMYETVFTGKITRKLARDYTDTKRVCNFKPVNKLLRTRRGSKIWQYWYTMDTDNYAGMITVMNDNPLKPLWDKLFDSGTVLNINAKLILQTIDNFRYFHVHRWELENTLNLA